jgi:hypothetical protein
MNGGIFNTTALGDINSKRGTIPEFCWKHAKAREAFDKCLKDGHSKTDCEDLVKLTVCMDLPEFRKKLAEGPPPQKREGRPCGPGWREEFGKGVSKCVPCPPSDPNCGKPRPLHLPPPPPAPVSPSEEDKKTIKKVAGLEKDQFMIAVGAVGIGLVALLLLAYSKSE